MSDTPHPSVLILFCLAALAALGLAAWWLMRGAARARPPDASAELAVYRSQLAEVDRDVAAGRLAEAAADAARLEIGRRLVRAQDRQDGGAARSGARSGAGAGPAQIGARATGIGLLALSAAVALGTVGLYLVRGTLEADQPFQQRERELLQRDPRELGDEEILTILQERARQNPSDPTPHVFMGQVLASIGREAEAIRAFQAALRRDPRNVDAMAELGGIVLQGNGGVMDEQASAIFAQASAIAPDHPMVRYYRGLSRWQTGARDGAIADWRTAWSALQPDDPQRNTLLARIVAELSRVEVGPGAADAAGDRGPFEAMAALPEAEREAFIAGMVSQRAARQAANPDDLGLRLSLLRVSAMTGDRTRAQALVADGLARSQSDPFELALIRAAAAAVGLPSTDRSPRGQVAK